MKMVINSGIRSVIEWYGLFMIYTIGLVKLYTMFGEVLQKPVIIAVLGGMVIFTVLAITHESPTKMVIRRINPFKSYKEQEKA